MNRAQTFLLVGILVIALGMGFSVHAYDFVAGGFERSGDGIKRSFRFSFPKSIGLGFGYCNPLSCGSSDNPLFDCFVGRYNPQFADESVETFVATPPPGGKPERIFLKAGSEPGVYIEFGYYDERRRGEWNSNILAEEPKFQNDKSVLLKFRIKGGPFEALRRCAADKSGRAIQGLSEEERDRFVKTYGNEYKNPLPIKEVTIEWGVADQTVLTSQTIQQSVQIDGNVRDVASVPLSVPPMAIKKVVTYRADKGVWKEVKVTDATFSTRGALPTVLASLLSSYGVSTDPGVVAKELTSKGVQWEQGADWNQIADYLRNHYKFQADEGTVFDAVRVLQNNGVVLVAYTNVPKEKGKTSSETALLITKYDTKKDVFDVVDPFYGKRTLSWEVLMKGQPWFLNLQKR